MKHQINSKMISVRIPSVICDQLDNLTHLTHKSRTDLVRQAILFQIEDMEDYYECVEIIKNRKPENYITLDEAMKSLGL